MDFRSLFQAYFGPIFNAIESPPPRCGRGSKTTLRSVLAVFATDNSGPEALADILAALPHASKVDCTDGVKELRRLRDG